MKSLGISVSPKHWNFEKGCPKYNCHNKEKISKIVLQTELEFKNKVIDRKSCKEEITKTLEFQFTFINVEESKIFIPYYLETYEGDCFYI